MDDNTATDDAVIKYQQDKDLGHRPGTRPGKIDRDTEASRIAADARAAAELAARPRDGVNQRAMEEALDRATAVHGKE